MISSKTAAPQVRHRWPDRLFHWAMAVSVLVLMFSAFLPIVDINFDWVTWHWIAGVCLTLLVVFHVIRVIFVHGFAPMMPRTDDIREVFTGDNRQSPLMAAKYDAYQKSYHWVVGITVLALIVTGIPMLIKLDTSLWDRNPGILSDIQWGYIYVVHGITSLFLIFLVILHIYFSLLPEHKKLLISMVTGRGPLTVRGSTRDEGES